MNVRCLETVQNTPRKNCIIPEEFQVCIGNYVPRQLNRILRPSKIDVVPRKRKIGTQASSKEPSPKKKRCIYKNGAVNDSIHARVDLSFTAFPHVYKSKDNITYACNLTKNDLQLDTNNFYKIKILCNNKQMEFGVLREYGRTGTSRKGNCFKKFTTAELAIEEFTKIYGRITGNPRFPTFNKIIGKYFHLDLDYNEAKAERLTAALLASPLDEPLKRLIEMVFSLEIIQLAMLEFDIDESRLPIGKISEVNIGAARKLILVIGKMLKEPTVKPNHEIFIGLSNRFYDFIPHSNKIPVINSYEAVVSKLKLLRELDEIKIAYRWHEKGDNPYRKNFESLQSEIKCLTRDSSDYKMIEKYAKETTLESRQDYLVEIEEIFGITKAYTNENFKPYESFKNRKLLWHGSRLTRFASILQGGLKTESENAGFNGSLYGNGIYFSDLFSVAADYSKRPMEVERGLVLLCEVALGEMYEPSRPLEDDFFNENLPEGKNSVKGNGMFFPLAYTLLENGCAIPTGPIQEEKNRFTVGNEYVIFRESQCTLRYIVQVKYLRKPK